MRVKSCKAGERWQDNREAEANKFGGEENDEEEEG